MKTKTLLTALTAAAFVGSAHAATITVEDTATGFNNNWGSSSISLSFSGLDLTGADKLVVSIGAQSTGSNDPDRDWETVTFNGVTMIEAVRRGGDTASAYQSGIYYLDADDLPVVGDLTVSATKLNVRGLSATAWVLSGTADGHGQTGASDGTSTSLTTTADDSWVLAHATVAGTTAPVAQSPLTAGLTVVNPYNGSSQTGNGTGYQTVALSGTNLTPAFDIGGTTVAAEFLAVPEPGSLALLGLGGLLVASRRRRG